MAHNGVRYSTTYQIDDVTEMDLDATLVKVRMPGRVVYQLRELALTHLRCPIAKDEEQGIDSVRLSRAVRANDRRE